MPFKVNSPKKQTTQKRKKEKAKRTDIKKSKAEKKYPHDQKMKRRKADILGVKKFYEEVERMNVNIK